MQPGRPRQRPVLLRSISVSSTSASTWWRAQDRQIWRETVETATLLPMMMMMMMMMIFTITTTIAADWMWQSVADPGGPIRPCPPWGAWPDWPLSKLTSLTSFFCCDHHNNKRRLRFNTVFLWLMPTFLPDTFWLQGCGRWVHALIFCLSIVFSWVITCFKLKILQRAKGTNLLCPLDVRGLKCFQLQGALPH